MRKTIEKVNMTKACLANQKGGIIVRVTGFFPMTFT